jgi:glycosyltransferase involved in cell wall biosynthesis
MTQSDVTYSVIIPVYNRPNEVDELLCSLVKQTAHNFEVIIVEDGSTVPCASVVELYEARGLNVKYFAKENEGRSIARNYGLERAVGEYMIFFDSDCVIPADYFSKLDKMRKAQPFDAFGGPDAADNSFTTTQKAINFAMTSFLTTGGIRGGRVSLEKFTPRTFNMGFSRKVYERVGGFREMFSEDIDMSTRIRLAGFSIGLYPDLYVYHKRRVDFRKFLRQVYVFGMSRITLKILYPDSLKLVHCLPAVFVLGVVAMIILAIFSSPWWLAPLALYLFAIWQSALNTTGELVIACKAVPAALIQLGGYGCGFLKAYFLKIFCRRGRNEAEEIAMRKGK